MSLLAANGGLVKIVVASVWHAPAWMLCLLFAKYLFAQAYEDKECCCVCQSNCQSLWLCVNETNTVECILNSVRALLTSCGCTVSVV